MKVEVLDDDEGNMELEQYRVGRIGRHDVLVRPTETIKFLPSAKASITSERPTPILPITPIREKGWVDIEL